MKNILKVVFVIIGTLIGAGFASGQEMYLFFFSYGIQGLIGILVSSTLIGIVIYKTLIIAKKHETITYKEFLEKLTNSKYKNIIKIINTVINTFIIVTFFIMIAGFGAYFEQELGINSLIGSGVLAIATFFVFRKSVKGVVKANEILVPILIMFVLIIGVINFENINILKFGNYIIQTNNGNAILSAVIYCSYNSILLIPVVLTLKNYVKNKKQIATISIITIITTIILSIIIFGLLIKVDVDITKLEMPAVYVVSNMMPILKYIYGFIILGSIFTTAISLGNSFLQNVSKNEKSYTQIALIMCITSVLISKIGFSNLVSSLYPIFGYLGIIQIVRILL